MLDDGTPEYVPDRLYERLFQPWTLPESEWPLCREDWARVDAISWLPWKGSLLDFGSGDGTLAALVCSRNPLVYRVGLAEQDASQTAKALQRWKDWPLYETHHWTMVEYDGALCCEVLEHLTPEQGHQVLCDIKRVLKSGAMLCVTVPHEDGTRQDYPGHISRFNIVTLGNLLRKAGMPQIDERLIPESDNFTKRKPIWIMATVCVV